MVRGKDKDYLRNGKGNIANNLHFRSLNRTSELSFEGTHVRKMLNKFAFSLT